MLRAKQQTLIIELSEFFFAFLCSIFRWRIDFFLHLSKQNILDVEIKNKTKQQNTLICMICTTQPASDVKAFKECVTTQTGVEIVASQSAALSSMLQAAGVVSCTSTTATTLAISGAGVTNGCEQIAVMTTALQAAENTFQCTFNKLMQTDSISLRINFQNREHPRRRNKNKTKHKKKKKQTKKNLYMHDRTIK